MRKIYAAALDLAVVVAFVAIGRSSHGEAESIGGFLGTLWPFAAGLAAGWLLTRGRSPQSWRSGLVIWPSTVAGGMILRVVSGQGIAVSFVIVAAIFLGLTLLGWRWIFARLADREPDHARS